MRLANKIALVTGSGSGIGKAIAQRFAVEGAIVIVNDVDDSGYQTAKEIVSAGGNAVFRQADLRSSDQVRLLIEHIGKEFEGLDILVNNAGVTGSTNVATATDVEWEQVMGVNLKGAWYCCKYAIPLMIEGGGGSIVNISSTHVMRTQKNHFPYHSAKSGMHTMALGICVDFGQHGIRANNVCPGFIWTPMAEEHMQMFHNREEKEKVMLSTHPLGRFGTPEDVAAAALFLASDESKYISGASLVVDGGRSAWQKAE